VVAGTLGNEEQQGQCDQQQRDAAMEASRLGVRPGVRALLVVVRVVELGEQDVVGLLQRDPLDRVADAQVGDLERW
jgi:hypothetical protein